MPLTTPPLSIPPAQLILEHPPEEWPEVDCLLSWYSDGFPLAKAQAYADLRRPFLVNDLAMQVTGREGGWVGGWLCVCGGGG